MAFGCNCDNTDPLTTIPDNTCPFNIDQVQRLYVVKGGNLIFDTATPASSVPVLAGDPTLQAGWIALRAAVDDTKVVVSPILNSPIITPGGAQTVGGGDNSTPNGIELVRGKLPSVFTAAFADITPAQETALQELGCDNLEVFMVTRDQKIWGQQLAADKFTGFPVDAFFVDDRGSEGLATLNLNQMRFTFKPSWSNTLKFIIPTDFDPLVF